MTEVNDEAIDETGLWFSVREVKMFYLILHKVRGEPAFDIAEKAMYGDEQGWCIPTSGHRAFPYWTKPLSDWYVANNGRFTVTMADAMRIEKMPDDWPDHYEVKPMKKQRLNVSAFISSFAKPQMRRRI